MKFGGSENAEAVRLAWPHLGHSDGWIQHAARLAVERQPFATWGERALHEQDATAAPAALLALARVGPETVQPQLLERLASRAPAALPPDQILTILRACEVAFIRLWCAKEAVLKAHGYGLAFGLDRLAFAETRDGLSMTQCDADLGAVDDWSLIEFVPAVGYRAALAWRSRR